MNSQNTFPGLAQQFALACGLCSLYHLLTLNSGVQYFPLVLLPYALTIYALNHLFLRQNRTMRGIVLLNAAFFTVLFVSVLLIEGIIDWTTMLFQGSFCLWITVWGAHCCLEPPKLRSLITSLDLSVLLLLLYTVLLSEASLSILWYAPAAAGCAASILALIAQRANRSPGLKEWGLLLLVFSGLSALMWLLVILAAAPVGQGLVNLWNALTNAVRWMARKLWALLLFLMSLFPGAEPEGTALMEPELSSSAEEMIVVEPNPAVFVILMAILAVAAITALILVLRQLGRLRVGGRRTSATAQRRSGRIPLRQALKRLWVTLIARLRLWVYLRQIRNTPEGLFHLIVRRCRLSPWRKRTGETPREFLTRLRETAAEDHALHAALGGLIPAVDAALYAPSPDRQVYPAARLIRYRFSDALRRQLFRQGREYLRTVPIRWRVRGQDGTS